MAAFAPNSLLAHLAQLPDPRSRHGRRFPLTALLATACAAILCGQGSYAAIAPWARNQPPELLQALGFYRRPPTDGAFRYLFTLLVLPAFEAALADWIAGLLPGDPDQLRPTPLDGKTLKGSDDKLRGAVHLLSLLDGPTGGVLKQTAVAPTTNEHKTAFALLDGLVLRGRVLTAGRPVLPPRPGRADPLPGRALLLRGEGQPGGVEAGHRVGLRAGLFPPTSTGDASRKTTRRRRRTATAGGSRCGRSGRRRG